MCIRDSSITWHLGYYQDRNAEKVYKQIKKGMKTVIEKLQEQNIKIWIRPETTGKKTQWGTLNETIKLSKELEMVLPCIDFSHLHARTNGKINTYEEFKEILTKVEKDLGRKGLDNMHCHISGIAYGEKGEKHHLNLKESDFNYTDLLRVFKQFKTKGVITAESPNLEKDALLLQKTYKLL